MTRAEFSKHTKHIAWSRSGGRCEQCTAKLYPGRFEYHHRLECTFAGTAELENCVVLCRNCHGAITRKQAAVIAKSNRVRAAHIGAKRKRPSFATNKNGTHKRFMDGRIERR